MCLFPSCDNCGCRDRTRKKYNVEVFSGTGEYTVEQITRTCNGCGKEHLSVLDRVWNKRRLEEVMSA